MSAEAVKNWLGLDASSRAKWAVSLAFGLFAAWLVWYSTATYGASASHFAMNNISAAQGLIAGRGLSTLRGEPFVLWGPVMPVAIAALKLVGLRYLDGARWLTIVSAFVFVALHARLLLELARSTWTAVLASALLIVSPQFLPIMASVRSQPLFLALTFGASWTLSRQLEAPRRLWLLATALLGAAICLDRYDGVLNVVALALVILVCRAAGAWKQRIRVAAVVSLVPALILLAWFLRNHAGTGSMLGPRRATPPGNAIAQMIDAWRTSTWWLVPWTEDLDLRTIIGIALFVIAAIGCVLLFVRRPDVRSRSRLALYTSFPLVYGGGLALVASVLLIDMIGQRILFPMLPFMLGLLLLSIEEFALLASTRNRSLALIPIAVGLLFVALHLAQGIPDTVREVARMREDGAGDLASAVFAGKPLAGWLREHELDGAVYSNSPAFVLLFGDHEAKDVDDFGVPRAEPALQTAPARSWLVWLTRTKGERARITEIESHIALERIVTLPDSVVLRLR